MMKASIYSYDYGPKQRLHSVRLQEVTAGHTDGVGGLLSQTIITPTTQKSYFPLADLSAKAYYAAEEASGNAVTYSDDAGVSPIRVSRGLCVVFFATTYSLICEFMLAMRCVI